MQKACGINSEYFRNPRKQTRKLKEAKKKPTQEANESKHGSKRKQTRKQNRKQKKAKQEANESKNGSKRKQTRKQKEATGSKKGSNT